MKMTRQLGMIAALLVLVMSPAAHAVTLSFTPSAQTVDLGSIASVDIGVSDLNGATLAAYDFILSWDPTVIAYLSANISNSLGADALQVTSFVNPYTVEFSVISFLDTGTLAALQTNPFSLVNLSFSSTGVGTSPLTLQVLELVGGDASLLDYQSIDGSITVREPTSAPVPEPGTVVLLGSGLAGLLLWARRRQPV